MEHNITGTDNNTKEIIFTVIILLSPSPGAYLIQRVYVGFNRGGGAY